LIKPATAMATALPTHKPLFMTDLRSTLLSERLFETLLIWDWGTGKARAS